MNPKGKHQPTLTPPGTAARRTAWPARASARLSLFGMLFWLATLSASAGNGEFRVSELSAQLVEGTYVMNTRIEYHFSDRVLEALDNGVPLTMEVIVRLRDSDAWWWQSDLLKRRLRYQIRYLSLSSVYQVVDLQSGTQQNFVTLESALDALGDIPPLPLMKQGELAHGKHYLLSVKAELDIEALPLPLRPMAYLTPSWNLSSEWRTWLLRP